MSKNKTTIKDSQIGVVGDNAHVDEIHFHGLFDRLGAWRKVHPWRFTFALICAALLAILASTALVGALSPDIRQALFLQGLWPRAFPKEREGEVLIIIATFHHSEGVTDTEAHNEIKQAIVEAVGDLDFATLRVEVDPNIRLHADDRDGAQALGDRYDASLVIWGADTGVRVSVNFYNRKQSDFEAADVQIEETVRTQLAAPSEYTEFITQELPDQLTFLSLFAVGQSYYAAEAYTASAYATEAAVARLGDTPIIEGAAEAYFHLAWLYQARLPNTSKAIANYTRALELDPADADACNNRGAIYSNIGEYDKALADFTCALELDPRSVEVYANRGNAYDDLGEYEKALADFACALELDPELDSVYNNRGNTYRNLSEYDKALADYTRAIELSPKDAVAYSNRGSTNDILGEYDKALVDYTHALELNPEYTLAYNNRGNTYCTLGEYDKALADYTRALELYPEDACTYYNRGNTYRIIDEYDKALADYTRAIELNPKYAAAYSNRGIIYGKMGDYIKALADYTRALEFNPVLAEAYNNRGIIYQEMGDYESAMADYIRAVELMPFPLTYYNLTRLNALQNNYSSACAWLEKAIVLDSQYRDHARTDPAFDSIRDEPCFQALMNGDTP